MEHALMCPQCNAPLKPQKFARSVVCSYCGATVQLDESAISAELFHQAFRAWNSPASYAVSNWLEIGESYWALGDCIAQGEFSDVYTAQRARWPTELALVKILRDPRDRAPLDNEWNVLQSLQRSEAPGAETFTTLLPQPVVHGDIREGVQAGRRASVFRWVSGFRHTFEDVLQAYPQGIPPRASIWVWRRILEVLSFLHNSGIAHGAILPSHLLAQENDHGVRLVGYGAAGPLGEKLQVISSRYESFYPHAHPALSAQLDIMMSARCIVALLGGDPATGSLPSAVPARLARLVQQIARTDPASARGDAWSLRQELGALADAVFGAPQFIPIVMPA